MLDALPDGTIVQIVVRMVDERRQHPLCQVGPVDLRSLPAVAANQLALSFVVCAANNSEIASLASDSPLPDNIWFEISHVESVNGVASIMELVGHRRLLFGTHMSLFYPESSLLKLKESDLSSAQLAAVKTDNVGRIRPDAEG